MHVPRRENDETGLLVALQATHEELNRNVTFRFHSKSFYIAHMLRMDEVFLQFSGYK